MCNHAVVAGAAPRNAMKLDGEASGLAYSRQAGCQSACNPMAVTMTMMMLLLPGAGGGGGLRAVGPKPP